MDCGEKSLEVNAYKKLTVLEWLRNLNKKRNAISNIWSGLVDSFQNLNMLLSWMIDNGFLVRFGVDPFIGGSNMYNFLIQPYQYCTQRDYFFLNMLRFQGIYYRWS